MSIKGFPSQQKNLTAEAGLSNNYVTVQPTGSGHYSLDTVSKSAFRVGSQTVPRTVGAGSTTSLIIDASTSAQAGDFIRFEGTADFPYQEIAILRVDGNNLYLAHKLSAVPTTGDEFFVMRYASDRVADDGTSLVTIAPSPIAYRRNLLSQEVLEDTSTPGNSRPLPVKTFNNAGSPVDLALESTASAIRTAVELIDNAIAGNEMQVDVVTLPGTAQADIAALNTKTPALGQALMVASTPVVIASNQSAVPISAASLPLPTGAATETTLAALNTKTPALGQALMTASQPVVIASNQSAVPISATALPLPTGAATETTLAAINTKTLAAGQALMAASSPVVIASNQTAVPISASSLPLPTGAATETTLAALNTKMPAQGQALMAASVPVVLASNQSAIPMVMSGSLSGGTISQAAVTVGTSAVRLTVSGSAPNSARKKLQFIIDDASSANFFMGGSSVASSGSGRGIKLYPGTLYTYDNNANDFFIISDTASQTVFIMEHT
jgi:hypothetical protein